MGTSALGVHPSPDVFDRDEPVWRREQRSTATTWLATHAMPTTKDESWRYTAVKDLMAMLDAAVAPRRDSNLNSGEVELLVGRHDGSQLVFVNGQFAPLASRLEAGNDVTLIPFSELGSDDTAGSDVTSISAMDHSRVDGFLALNRRDGGDGALLRIGPGANPGQPIHLVHVTVPVSDETLVIHPASIIALGAGAEATVVESYVGMDGPALTNASTTIDVGDGAVLSYHRIQNEAASANHVGHVRARVGGDARFATSSFSIGASVSRVAIDVTAEGDGSTLDLDGLYLPAANERHDHVLTVEHLGSHTSSNQRFKGIVDGRAHGAFTGHIIVARGTVDTSAHQTNHSLLLTSKAESDTRPWLEILADDVRCTHGATIGRLDDAALFYLRSRGIPEAAARNMLIDAFAGEIVDAVSIESLREFLVTTISAKQTLAANPSAETTS